MWCTRFTEFRNFVHVQVIIFSHNLGLKKSTQKLHLYQYRTKLVDQPHAALQNQTNLGSKNLEKSIKPRDAHKVFWKTSIFLNTQTPLLVSPSEVHPKIMETSPPKTTSKPHLMCWCIYGWCSHCIPQGLCDPWPLIQCIQNLLPNTAPCCFFPPSVTPYWLSPLPLPPSTLTYHHHYHCCRYCYG